MNPVAMFSTLLMGNVIKDGVIGWVVDGKEITPYKFGAQVYKVLLIVCVLLFFYNGYEFSNGTMNILLPVF